MGGGQTDHIGGTKKQTSDSQRLSATSLTALSPTASWRTADGRTGWGGRTQKQEGRCFGGGREGKGRMRLVRHSPQERGSSELSGQSAPPSQYQWAGMQRPLEQRNSLWEHVDAAEQKKGMKSISGQSVCVS